MPWSVSRRPGRGSACRRTSTPRRSPRPPCRPGPPACRDGLGGVVRGSRPVDGPRRRGGARRSVAGRRRQRGVVAEQRAARQQQRAHPHQCDGRRAPCPRPTHRPTPFVGTTVPERNRITAVVTEPVPGARPTVRGMSDSIPNVPGPDESDDRARNDELRDAAHSDDVDGVSDREQRAADTSYSPSSERETVASQTQQRSREDLEQDVSTRPAWGGTRHRRCGRRGRRRARAGRPEPAVAVRGGPPGLGRVS